LNTAGGLGRAEEGGGAGTGAGVVAGVAAGWPTFRALLACEVAAVGRGARAKPQADTAATASSSRQAVARQARPNRGLRVLLTRPRFSDIAGRASRRPFETQARAPRRGTVLGEQPVLGAFARLSLAPKA
jgi:hypothetical protein